MYIIRQTVALLIVLVMADCVPAIARDEIRAETLRGIDRVSVKIGKLTPLAVDYGVTEESLRTQVELELRRNGLKVVNADDVPMIYVALSTLKAGGQHAVHLSLHLDQDAPLKRNLKILAINATTWSNGYVGDNCF